MIRSEGEIDIVSLQWILLYAKLRLNERCADRRNKSNQEMLVV
jgi:hypothetical protein